MERVGYLTHAPIEFHFAQSSRDFVVEEIPLYPFSGAGEHLILKIRKKNQSTPELLEILSSHLGIKTRDIGYAGLKDKSAMTIQHLSIPAKFEERLKLFVHPNVKILETMRHNNKLRIGHLKGNRFFIRLKKLSPLNANKINEALKNISTFGLPNYFGYQRFGKDGKNHDLGKRLAHGEARLQNRRQRDFLISAYQSKLFNDWLKSRITLSRILQDFSPGELRPLLKKELQPQEIKRLKEQPHPFKLLEGDLLHHYPYGKLFPLEEGGNEEVARFMARDVVPTGALVGEKVKMADGMAGLYELPFTDTKLKAQGSRRFAWIFPEDLQFRYIEEEAWGELNFYLPKGSYATILLEELAHREIHASAEAEDIEQED